MDKFLIYDMDRYPWFQCSSPFFFVWFLPKVKLKVLIEVFFKIHARIQNFFPLRGWVLVLTLFGGGLGIIIVVVTCILITSFFFKNEFFTGSGLRAHLIPSWFAHEECDKNIKRCLCNQTVIFARMIAKLPRLHAQWYKRCIHLPLIFS